MCFPVKFLGTPFFIEHLRWLLLRIFQDMVFLKILQYLQGNTCVGVFFNKDEGLTGVFL